MDEFRAVGVSEVPLAHVPPGRLKALARYAATARAQAIARRPDERRLATLLALAQGCEVIALDEALDLVDLLMSDRTREATTQGQKTRLRTRRDVDAAALPLRAACQVLLDERMTDTALRRVLVAHMPRASLVDASTTVGTLPRPADDQDDPALVEH